MTTCFGSEKGYCFRSPYTELIGRIVTLSFCLMLCFSLSAQSLKVSFSFSLTSSSNTSAAVFDANGNLIRHLWSNVRYPSGTHIYEWDRLDEFGHFCPDSGYVFKLLSNNVHYTWEGTLGNSSDSLKGSSKIRAYDRIHSMAFSGRYMYYGTGYSEGVPSCYKLDVNNPQNKINILFNYNGDVDQQCNIVCTDSQYVYWAGADPFSNKSYFVYATKVDNDSIATFQYADTVRLYYGRDYFHALDYDSGSNASIISGIAVQKSSDFLYISHKYANQVRVFDKKSGLSLDTISVNAPSEIVCQKNGDVWLVSGSDSLLKYRIDTSSGIPDSLLTNISLPGECLAMAISNDDSTIAVILGDTFQQVFFYDAANGNFKGSLGLRGGYANGPLVSDDKFYFSDEITGLSKPYLVYGINNSLYVGDVGNERTQHFDDTGAYIESIMYLPHSYSVTADINDSSRVFNEFLEFKVDYSKALSAGNNSWKLHRNWRYGIDKEHFRKNESNVFWNLVTLSNGETYANIRAYDSGSVFVYPEIIHLPDSSNIRYSGVRWEKFASDIIMKDGSRVTLLSNENLGDSGFFTNAELNGFDSLDFPIWDTPDTIAILPAIENTDPAYNGNIQIRKTKSDKLVLFNPDKHNRGFHLGAINVGENEYEWKGARATDVKYRGVMPDDGAFDIGNRVEYPGGRLLCHDDDLFWNYHGEYWKNSQTNIWNHIHGSGLMIGQFGTTVPDGITKDYEAFEKGAGNVLSSQVVKVGNDYYLYHCDESVHSGIHRWKITGLNSVAIQTIQPNYQPVANGKITLEFFNGKELDVFGKCLKRMDSGIYFSAVPSDIVDSSSMSIRYSGYVKAPYSANYYFKPASNSGLRLWVDHALVSDRWSNSLYTEFVSDTIWLEKGQIYPIKLETKGTSARLRWGSDSFTTVQVPGAYLYPMDTFGLEPSFALLEGVENFDVLKDSLYGWRRSPLNEVDSGIKNHWLLRTRIKTFGDQDVDLFMTYSRDSGTATVIREIGRWSDCPVSWRFEGELNLDEDFNLFGNTKHSAIQVLDVNGKAIVSVSHVMNIVNNVYYAGISVNDSVMYSRAGRFFNTYTNRFQSFGVAVDSNGIDVWYGDYRVDDLDVSDSSSDWRHPGALRLNFTGGKEMFGSAIGLKSLTYSTKDSLQPKIFPDADFTFCTGDTFVIRTDTGYSYSWSNGDTSATVEAFLQGEYSVKVSDGTCSGTSKIINIGMGTLPNPSITEIGNVLYSNYGYGNQWYYGGVEIGGATDTLYIPTLPGVYSLEVTDTNGCSKMVDLLVPLNFENNDRVVFCIGDATMRIVQNNRFSVVSKVEMSFDGGLVWKESERNAGIKSWSNTDGEVYADVKMEADRTVIYRITLVDEEGVEEQMILHAADCEGIKKLELAPNPFDDRLSLMLPLGIRVGSLIEIAMMDASGVMVLKETFKVDETSAIKGLLEMDGLDVLTSGVYMVTVSLNGELKYVQKMIRFEN